MDISNFSRNLVAIIPIRPTGIFISFIIKILSLIQIKFFLLMLKIIFFDFFPLLLFKEINSSEIFSISNLFEDVIRLIGK